ncbi:MAG: hypothetical protein HQK91_03440 [Nitrospirae bacterium]|nr:hypothetical protein [Nitrospirota bacterium]MBF0540490.1 hypothetical protein [Nitrospirota bacterium]
MAIAGSDADARPRLENELTDPETHAAGGLVTGVKGVVGQGEFVMTKAATANLGTNYLEALNNFHIPALPKLPSSSLQGIKEGGSLGNLTQNVVHLDINDKSYPMVTKESIYKELMNDFNIHRSYRVTGQKPNLMDYMQERYGW